jgi:hypothetical protein
MRFFDNQTGNLRLAANGQKFPAVTVILMDILHRNNNISGKHEIPNFVAVRTVVKMI